MLRWFTENGVAANLIAFILVVGGLLALPFLEVEMFPETSLDQISITVPYPGATPQEVEEGIVIRIEEVIQGVEGIKRIRSVAAEGAGSVAVELLSGYEPQKVKENLKTRVDSITTFPVDAERPIVEEVLLPRDVLYLAIAGDADEKTLRELAERVRDDLVAISGISQVQLLGVRNYEIAIEVTEHTLRAYGLTFDEVVAAVQASSLDVPGGSIKAAGGEILLRTLGQAYVAEEFEKIVLRANPDGTRVTLGSVATINDSFVDTDIVARFDGRPAAFLRVAEIGDESPLDISEKVSSYIEEARARFPAGVTLVKFADGSFYLKDRLNLLVKNGLLGLLLVMAVLTAFLRPMLAVFVAIGIPISFLGTLFVAPAIGLSINLISLFAFILVLGIVVDDAIVVGESIFTEYQRNGPGIESAVRGAHAVAVPVVFAVLTTMVAFVPLFFLPGVFGKFFIPVPQVVILTLLWSLVESKLVLPYHLTLIRTAGTHRSDSQLNWFQRSQRRVADGLERFIERVYQPFLQAALRRRYVTIAAFVASVILTFGLVAGGWVRQVPFPVVPSDFIRIDLQYPAGTPVSEVQRGIARIQAAMEQVNQRHAAAVEDGRAPVQHLAVFSGIIGSRGFDTTTAPEPHAATLLAELTKAQAREISAIDLTREWREAVGTLPGAKSLVFIAETQTTTEKPIDIQLQGRDFARLQDAAREIKLRLADFTGVFDIADNFTSGKREIQLRLEPRAEILGVSSRELGRQVRSAFYGAEAQRIQRGRNDVRVMVRYPREDRESIASLETMRVRLPDGSAVPFSEVASIAIGQGFATIQREDRHRVLNITANIDGTQANVPRLTREVQQAVNDILARYPDVTSALEGQAAENAETARTMLIGLVLVLAGIYALIAIPFKSYVQPLIVLTAVPFALVGAIVGHFVTFQAISMLSAMGIIAAVGVVVNDSLVMVDYVNQRVRQDGVSVAAAALEGGVRRFRPILLTSLTTFAGLMPILLERSLQAQFLIPMATSLAFGVLLATFVTLLLVPATYLALEDAKRAARRALNWSTKSSPAPEAANRDALH
jgi:multidrug efflux pump subunit AcrB